MPNQRSDGAVTLQRWVDRQNEMAAQAQAELDSAKLSRPGGAVTLRRWVDRQNEQAAQAQAELDSVTLSAARGGPDASSR